MRTVHRWLAVLVVLPACSTSSSPSAIADASAGDDSSLPATGAGGAVGAGGKTATGGAASSKGGTAGTKATGGAPGAGGKIPSAGGHSAADAAVSEASAPVEASAECVTYCTCMATNCADQIFAKGCLVACAEQTKWDLGCRQNMCGLVPAQPANNHCVHAFGVDQCLDNP